MKLKIPTKPFGNDVKIYKKANVELSPGLTVLVGCNGAGKTTFLEFVEEHCKDNDIPCYHYDNIHDGGIRTIERIMFENGGGGELLAGLFGSSEGEMIHRNIEYAASKLRRFLETGRFVKTSDKMFEAIRSLSGRKEKSYETNVRVLIFDGIDSGFSIDMVEDVKDFFNIVLEDSEKLGLETYILVSANAFEMASGELCFDVIRGVGCTFSNYESYKEFVLGSRKEKDKRYKKRE